jgi:hypothetical protein
MTDLITANYEFVLPEPNGSDNTWGIKLNDNWTAADTILHSHDSRIGSNEVALATNAAFWSHASAPAANGSRGWCQLPNGLVMQWGREVILGTSLQSVTFPVQFQYVYAVSITSEKVSTGGGFSTITALGSNPTTTGFTATVNTNHDAFHWQAIGYGYVV